MGQRVAVFANRPAFARAWAAFLRKMVASLTFRLLKAAIVPRRGRPKIARKAVKCSLQSPQILICLLSSSPLAPARFAPPRFRRHLGDLGRPHHHIHADEPHLFKILRCELRQQLPPPFGRLRGAYEDAGGSLSLAPSVTDRVANTPAAIGCGHLCGLAGLPSVCPDHAVRRSQRRTLQADQHSNPDQMQKAAGFCNMG